MNSLYHQIIAEILGISDENVRAKLARLIPGAKATGATIPELRDLVARFRLDNQALTLEQACDLMDELCRGRVREEILFGVFLLGGYGKQLSSLPWRRLQPWLESLDNWETCDQLASNVSGTIVASNLDLVERLVALSGSEDPWKRRFALATAVELNHKGRSHPEETLRICTPLLNDPEPIVRKAVAWALKEASKKSETRVFEFLVAHKERIPASVLREASEKLSPAHKRIILG
jgi:3-methyladenine DNA glycosylase AlkD